mgnify:CR=1 FL=1
MLCQAFENMDRDRMLIETQMVKQLYDRNLVMLTEMDGKKIFDPCTYSPSSGMTISTAGDEWVVSYWKQFNITPAGKYLLREMFLRGISTVGWTMFVAAVSAIVALFVAR